MSAPLFALDFLSVEMFHYLPKLPDLILLAIVILLPTLGYIDLLRSLITTHSPAFCNIYIAIILFFSNLLRCIYWIFEPIEVYLLGQSIAVVVVQFMLVFGAFYFVEEKHGKPVVFLKITHRKQVSYYARIWKVKTAQDFLVAIIGYVVLISAVSFAAMSIFGVKQICTVLIVIANIVETGVSFPQFMEIVVNRRIENSSSLLVSQFAFGDLSKIAMFLWAGSGWPFVMGGILQFCVDSFVGISFLWQKRNGGKSGKDLNREPVGMV
jgi:hypothetical protein